MSSTAHVYAKSGSAKIHRGVDLISDALPFSAVGRDPFRCDFHLNKNKIVVADLIAATSFQLTMRDQHPQVAKDSRGHVATARQRQYNPYPLLD